MDLHPLTKKMSVCDYAIYYYLLNMKMAIVSELHPQRFELEILLNSLPLVTLWAPYLFTPTPHAKLTRTNNPLVNSLLHTHTHTHTLSLSLSLSVFVFTLSERPEIIFDFLREIGVFNKM